MSHTYYPFSLTTETLPRQQMILRNAASSKYGGDWHSIPHAHDYTELFYIIGGDGQFQINDSLFPVQAHQLVVVNPNTIHTEVSYEAHPLEYIVLGIEGLELTIPDSDEARYCIYSFHEHNDVLVCMQHVLQEMQERKPEYQALCLAYLEIIMVQLIRNASVSVTPTHSRFPANRQCASVRQYIDQHYKETITLDILAEKVSINKYYMAHVFKREYGVSPINYLIACRIREGKRLLAETDLSLSQISAVLGFSSSSYFSQSFRNAEGISPTEYRKTHQRRKSTAI
ncbi:MAG: helix-turn-helix transcriptional regulator [Oscillospiraceae bacterium]|nr:helix-turn-helix transcriptional regulator [Oscillospiraceae bacterium]